MGEVSRVLKPDGEFHVADWHLKSRSEENK